MNSHPLTVWKRIPWGYLAWTVPLAYVFWAPYQQSAGALEWTLTTLTLVAVLSLFLAGLAYGEHRRAVGGVSIALLVIAIGFLAYRPSGGMFFPVVATFVAAAVGGRIGRSIVLVSMLAVLFGGEWWFFYHASSQAAIFPLFVLAQIVLTGIGSTFVFRKERELHRYNRAAERERIAKDLHDVLGHSLTTLALKAELARRLFHSNAERAFAEIGDIERIARQGLEDMRGVIHGYYSGDVYAELDRVEALLEAADVRVTRHCESLEMSPANERVLGLILREAVTNILRHSHAKACRLALYRTEGIYRFDICDDGRGGEHVEGIGMRSIRARAEALGGKAVWSGGNGTQLSVSLPTTATNPG